MTRIRDVEIEGDVEIEVDEFLDECSEDEVEDVVKWLRENGHLKDADFYQKFNAVESIYEEALDKLHGKWNRLSHEEETAILKIANKFDK